MINSVVDPLPPYASLMGKVLSAAALLLLWLYPLLLLVTELPAVERDHVATYGGIGFAVALFAFAVPRFVERRLAVSRMPLLVRFLSIVCVSAGLRQHIAFGMAVVGVAIGYPEVGLLGAVVGTYELYRSWPSAAWIERTLMRSV